MTSTEIQPAPRRSRGRIVGILAALVVVGGLSVPGYWLARARSSAPPISGPSIKTEAPYQDPALLERAWALPVASAFKASFVSQRNGSTCGPTSLANVERSFGLVADERSVVDGTGKCWTGMCFGGLTLEEVASVAGQRTQHKVTILRDLDETTFREHLARSNDPTRRYVVNFHRGPLFGKGGGHYSPIGGYLEKEDLVFVLDVNAEYKPWLVDAHRLYLAVNTVDVSSEKKRGLLLLE
jgi:hypothetical protein